MRQLFSLFVLAFAVALPASAQGKATSTITCKDGTTSATAGKGACSHHGGVGAVAVAPAQVPCGDGTMSDAGRGACSHHGGIAKSKKADRTAAAGPITYPRPTTQASPTVPSATPAPAPTPSSAAMPRRAPTPTASAHAAGQASAKCKDGTLSYSANRRGTCSHHGGVSVWY